MHATPDDFERRFDELFDNRFSDAFDERLEERLEALFDEQVESRFDELYDQRRDEERRLGGINGDLDELDRDQRPTRSSSGSPSKSGGLGGFDRGLGTGRGMGAGMGAGQGPGKGYGGYRSSYSAISTSYGSLSPRYRQPSAEAPVPFEIDAKLAQRFNAYAAEAFPREIGGMLRIVEIDGVYRAIDMKIFPHLAASGVYFELDGEEVARFLTSLALAKRKDEIPEWRGLVHSHPNMRPFMSGTDYENLRRLAGKKWAFSLICSATSDPSRNYFAVHYAQAQPWALVVEDLPTRPSEHDQILSGTSLLSDDELTEIAADVRKVLGEARNGWWSSRSGAVQSPRLATAYPERDPDFIDIAWSDAEYRILEDVIDEAKGDGERLSTTDEELEQIRGLVEQNEPVSYEHLQLLSVLLADRHQAVEEESNAPDDSQVRAVERLLKRVERRLESAPDSSADQADSSARVDFSEVEGQIVEAAGNWAAAQDWHDDGSLAAARQRVHCGEPLDQRDLQALEAALSGYADERSSHPDGEEVEQLRRRISRWRSALGGEIDVSPPDGVQVFSDDPEAGAPYPAASAVAAELPAGEDEGRPIGSMA